MKWLAKSFKRVSLDVTCIAWPKVIRLNQCTVRTVTFQNTPYISLLAKYTPFYLKVLFSKIIDLFTLCASLKSEINKQNIFSSDFRQFILMVEDTDYVEKIIQIKIHRALKSKDFYNNLSNYLKLWIHYFSAVTSLIAASRTDSAWTDLAIQSVGIPSNPYLAPAQDPMKKDLKKIVKDQ